MLQDKESILYRLGGDEFAVLSPVEFKLDLKKIFTELDELLHKYHKDISMAYGSILLTKENTNRDQRIEKKMHLADKKMYSMKEAFYKESKIQHGGKKS